MIRVSHLSKAFDERPVLRDVSLEVREGETLAVIGRSGSGKSVLLKHLLRLLVPDEGTVEVDGQDLATLSYGELRHVRQQFGVLFQGGALFDSLSVADNIAFPLRTFTRASDADIRDRVDECLRLVRLEDVGVKRPSEISGGMQKRAALARAVALEPRYLLYDEPTSGLDPQTARAIDELIKDLSDELNVTSVVITHDMYSALDVADRIVFLHQGEVRWSGTPGELRVASDPVLLDFVRAGEYRIEA
ncbi:MAG: ATP-binding cassette domain-containing protein [Rhodothermales bacterium]|nr:ATP-binding cassette domain-containing protein [Rhodothermales bacterium]